jgi:GNAT superfamily N-acetyltransferase
MAIPLVFHPLTPERWSDLERLFEKDEVCRTCWCMWWRISAAQWLRQRGEENRKALKAIVDSGKVPGIMAYSRGQLIGWCSISPREDFHRLVRSRTLKRIDDKPVWSVVCFFVAKPFRRQGVSTRLLGAAIDYARRQGAENIEGYPSRSDRRQPDPLVYTGLVSSFQKFGFVEVNANSKTRKIMRYAFERT